MNFTSLFENNSDFNFSLKQQIIKKSNLLNIKSNLPFLALNFENNNYKIIQNSDLNKNNIDVNTNYAFHVKKTVNALFMEYSSRKDNFKTTEEQFSQFENDVVTENSVQSFGLQTKFKFSAKTTFSSALSYSRIQFKMHNSTDTKWLFTPQISLKTDFSSSHYIKFSFSSNNSLVQAENVIPNGVVHDYRTIYSNVNLNLNSVSPNNQAGIDYFYLNAKRKLSIISNLSYYKATNIISNNSSANTAVNLIQYQLAPFENRFNSMLYSEKTLSTIPFSIRASASYSFSSKILYSNTIAQYFKTESTSGYISFVSRFAKTSLQFETGIAISQDIYKETLITNKILINNPFIETSFKISNTISFVTKFSYKKLISSTIANEIYQLSPRIRLSLPKSKVEISLIAHDILNIKNYEQIALTRFDNFTEERISQSLPGFYLLNITIKL